MDRVMEKETIQVARIDVERDTLFGEIGAVINYLSKIRTQYKNGENIYLNEEWSGYEDNYFEIIVSRLETDDECKTRIDKENKEQLRVKEEQRQKPQKKKKKERRKFDKK